MIIFVLLLFCSAFFSASETALFSLSGVQLHRFKEAHGQSAIRIVEYLRRPRKMLVTILLGNELANVSVSIVGAAVINRLMPVNIEAQAIIAVAVITPIVLVFGEIIPKNVSLRYAPKLAPVIIWPLHLFYKIARPVRAVLTWIADRFIILFGGEPKRAEPMIMEDEFRRLVDLGKREGVIVEEERELIHKVFEFTDKVVGDIMTPTGRIFMLPIDLPYEQMMEEVRKVQFSRVPFYEGTRNNVVGILHVRNLFTFHRRRVAGESLEIRDMLNAPLFIDTATPLEILLREFQRTQLHIALVRSKDGNLVGIVTMDDVLRELFGEMK